MKFCCRCDSPVLTQSVKNNGVVSFGVPRRARLHVGHTIIENSLDELALVSRNKGKNESSSRLSIPIYKRMLVCDEISSTHSRSSTRSSHCVSTGSSSQSSTRDWGDAAQCCGR